MYAATTLFHFPFPWGQYYYIHSLNTELQDNFLTLRKVRKQYNKQNIDFFMS